MAIVPTFPDWVTPGRAPTDEQRRLHDMAMTKIAHNMSIMRPGIAFREFVEKTYVLPESMTGNRYSVSLHGTGLCDEYPSIPYPEDWESFGHDAHFEAGMVVSFEAYIGEDGGAEGIKLERQAVITENGPVLMDGFTDALCARGMTA